MCTCYVMKLGEEMRFSIRYGAHSYSCPSYRKSRDPVDRQKDADIRDHLEHRFN